MTAQHLTTIERIETVKILRTQETGSEIHQIFSHGQKLLDQKAAVIIHFKDELRRTSEHFNKVNEMQTIGQREAEMIYKEKLFQVQNDFEERKKNLTDQYDHLITKKEADLRKFMDDAERYVKDKK